MRDELVVAGDDRVGAPARTAAGWSRRSSAPGRRPPCPAAMMPGPAPVTTIHPWSARSAGHLAGLLVDRVVGAGPGRAEDRHLGHVLERREDPERVAHLGQRRGGDLEVEPVDVVGGEGDGHGQQVACHLGVAHADRRPRAGGRSPAWSAGAAGARSARGWAWDIAGHTTTGPGRRPHGGSVRCHCQRRKAARRHGRSRPRRTVGVVDTEAAARWSERARAVTRDRVAGAGARWAPVSPPRSSSPGFWRDGRNPVVAVGEWIIDHVPGAVKDWAIRTFGTNDKLALIVGTLVVLCLVVGLAGPPGPAPPDAGAARHHRHRAHRRLASLDHPNASAASVLPAVSAASPSGRRAGVAQRTGVPAEGGRADDAARHSRPPPRQAWGPTAATFLLSASAIGAGRVRRRWRRPGAAATLRGGRRPGSELVLPAAGDAAGGAGRRRPRRIRATRRSSPPTTSSTGSTPRCSCRRCRPDRWRLRVHGLVEREIELGFDDLLRRPLVERDVTLSCVSNEVGGGLVGNAVWRGALLADLLDEAGVNPPPPSCSAPPWTAGRAAPRCPP